jgi:4-hydroxy-tetrahydrodipicolinate reductase
MDEPIRVGVGGALGRMGQAIITVTKARAGLNLAALYDRAGTEGEVAAGLVLASSGAAMAACDVVIDFSTAEAATELAEAAAARGGPALVIGPTGWAPSQEVRVAEAARRVAIVKTGNFSLGVNILAGLVEEAARRLPAEDWDVEIVEAHHRRKVDAPSGTALMLGEAAAVGRGIDLAASSERGRDGITGARKMGAIGFAVLRGGGIVGEHSVTFAADDEIVTLSHSARDRSLFARGAVAAAAWVAGKPPGLYDMKDVLGFRQTA